MPEPGFRIGRVMQLIPPTRTTIAGAVAACLIFFPGAVQAESLEQIAGRQAPHKAIYALSIDRIEAAADLVHADGAIYYESRVTCTEWRMRQRFRLRLTRNGRDTVESETDSLLVEARDGRRLTFEIVTRTDGAVTERQSGVATLNRVGGAGTVEMREPRPARIELPAGTVFPTWHYLNVVRAAERGRRTIWSNIFDGSDEDGQHSGINVVVLERSPPPGKTESRPLLQRPGWLMRIAYFAPERADGSPTYSSRVHMTDNGIARDMLLDYGSFTLTGTLKALEPLAPPDC